MSNDDDNHDDVGYCDNPAHDHLTPAPDPAPIPEAAESWYAVSSGAPGTPIVFAEQDDKVLMTQDMGEAAQMAKAVAMQLGVARVIEVTEKLCIRRQAAAELGAPDVAVVGAPDVPEEMIS